MTTTIECRVLYDPLDDGLRFLPEGPRAAGDGRISWVAIQHGADAREGSLNVLECDSGNNRRHALPGRPGFAIPTESQDRFLVGMEKALGVFDVASGDWEGLDAVVEPHVGRTMINDGEWFSEGVVFGTKDVQFADGLAGLYVWRTRDRRLTCLADGQICSNGKALISSPDGWILFDIDSPRKRVMRYLLDLNAGRLSSATTAVDLAHLDSFPDGMVLTPDQQSVIVALYDPNDPEAGEAHQYALADGRCEAVWRTPGSPQVTCPLLVRLGGDVKLVLTTAVEHMSPDRRARHPRAGSLFVGDTPFTEVPDGVAEF